MALSAGKICLKLAVAGVPRAALSSLISAQLFRASKRLIYPGDQFITLNGSLPFPRRGIYLEVIVTIIYNSSIFFLIALLLIVRVQPAYHYSSDPKDWAILRLRLNT